MRKNSTEHQKLKLLVSLLILCAAILSCSFVRYGCGLYTKDAHTDSADDIYDVILSKTGDGEFLITIETIFQGKRNTKQGIRGGYDGYWEKRISCYDIETGELESRYVCGKREEADCFMLGRESSRVWFFSIDKELGLHARDLPSLELAVTHKEILDANPGFEFIEAPVNEISQYFRFEKNLLWPTLKDKNGNEYVLNPYTLKAEPPQREIEYYNSNPAITTNSLELATNRYIKISPDGMVTLDKKQTMLEGLIKGEFLESSIITTIPQKEDQVFSRDISEIITGDNGVFLLSQDKEGDDSKCVISRINMNQDSTVELDWQVILEEYYRYPKTLEDGPLESLFSKGNPDYSTMKVLHTDDKLIFIYNLKMLCFDVDSGDTVWEMEL